MTGTALPRARRTPASVALSAAMLLASALGAGCSERVEGEVWAIRGDAELIRFAETAPEAVVAIGTVPGLQAGERVVGLDFRPADGKLYALTSAGQVLIVDPETALTTPLQPITGDGTALVAAGFGVDFNPAANALRIIGSDGQNLRVPAAALTSPPPATPVATLVDGRMGDLQGVTAAAYTNPNPGSEGTVLYVIDSEHDRLLIQDANVGRLTEVGALGVDASAGSGYDIVQTATANEHYALLQTEAGNGLYVIDAGSGLASLLLPLPDGDYRGLVAQVDGLLALQRRFDLLRTDASGDVIETRILTLATGVEAEAAQVRPITGLAEGEHLLGLDQRTTALDDANGLYAVSDQDHLLTLAIDETAGSVAAATVATLSTPLLGTAFGVDFNPRADLLRIVSDRGQNLRVNLQDGRVIAEAPRSAGFAFVDGTTRDVAPAPAIVATAYRAAPVNGTFQYAIDAAASRLVRVAVPNDGALVPVGPLGVTLPADGAIGQSLDIAGSDDRLVFAALRQADETVSTLYRVDLDSGAATAIGPIGSAGPVSSIAVRGD